MEKVIESTEQITVFRDEHGDVKGFVITDYQSNGEATTAYEKTLGGYKWIAHGDKQEGLHEARERFFYHSHFCTECRYDVDCEHSYKCDEPDKDQLCDECQDKQNAPEDAHLEGAYEARTELLE